MGGVVKKMEGERIGGVLIVKRGANHESGCASWVVECDKGHRFERTGLQLRACRKRKGTIKCPVCAGLPATTPSSFMRRNRNISTCSECGATDHNRATCEIAKSRKSAFCEICAGLPHRRPPEGCPGCDKPFAAERLPTLDDIMKGPRSYTREVA